MSKYLNAVDMMPHYVSWGGEVNAAHFHNGMEQQWQKDNSVYNELFYKELIGKKIFFAFVENTISAQIWYQENRAYRPQIVAYTISKLVLEAKKIGRQINFRSMWDLQKVPDDYYQDVANIAHLVFDTIYDEHRSTANIETYCKKEECWKILQAKPYALSETLRSILISPSERNEEHIEAKKEQKLVNGIANEIGIFTKGSTYWESLISRGVSQKVLKSGEAQMLQNAVKYCNGVYAQLTKYQLKEIGRITTLLAENGIE